MGCFYSVVKSWGGITSCCSALHFGRKRGHLLAMAEKNKRESCCICKQLSALSEMERILVVSWSLPPSRTTLITVLIKGSHNPTTLPVGRAPAWSAGSITGISSLKDQVAGGERDLWLGYWNADAMQSRPYWARRANYLISSKGSMLILSWSLNQLLCMKYI